MNKHHLDNLTLTMIGNKLWEFADEEDRIKKLKEKKKEKNEKDK